MALSIQVKRHDVNTVEGLNTALNAAKDHDLVVVYFWADFHDACKAGGQMDQILTAISSKYGATKTSSPSENSNVSKNGEVLSPLNMIIIKAEAERVSVFAERYNISMVPTFLLLTKKVQQNEDESDTKVLNAGKDSDDSSFEQLDLIEGVKPNELVKAIEKQLNDLKSKAVLKMANGLNYSNYDLAMNEVDTQARIVKGLEQDQLKLKLKELVNASKTMLFIKGTPDDPRCKYTRELLDLFKAEKSLSFGSYNVLTDREENKQVREGLKGFSGWNTYPQVFHNGKLVGGLDSIKELRQKNNDSIAQGFAKLDEEYLKERSLEDARHISKSVNETKGSEVTKEVTDDLNARLKSLISRSEVMLFMKGSPNEPRCGFSDRIVRLLKDQQVTFGSFDILTDEAVRQGLKIFSNWPTFPQLYVRGELVGGLDIVQEMAAEGALKEQLGLTGENEKENLNKRLKALIESNKVMLFMKGTPNEPRCGFSRQVVQILNEEGCQFGSFDILSDEDVRQGLKTYSNWPTYPQVYVKGELVGGLDVLKEMRDDGELRDALDL